VVIFYRFLWAVGHDGISNGHLGTYQSTRFRRDSGASLTVGLIYNLLFNIEEFELGS
jgi:hypothetical protein